MFYAISLGVEVFLLLLCLQFVLGVASFLGGLRFYRYVTQRLNADSSDFEGYVSVIVPCRGEENGLLDNLTAIIDQERDDFEVLFVVDSESDSAMRVIRKSAERHEKSKVIVAGNAIESGQKVHNLIEAVKAADKRSRALVFVDSDARPSPDWLRRLLAPLSEKGSVCSSGYRWFVPGKGGLATHLRAVWNASITSALGPDRESNFCWGGSTAIRRDAFDALAITEHWRGTVSDDFVITNVLRKENKGVHFEPGCLLPTVGNCSMAELLEFTSRQMKITRTYSPKHFKISLIGSILFTVTFFPAIALLFFLEGVWFYAALFLIVSIWVLGTLKALVRLFAVRKCLNVPEGHGYTEIFAHLLLWPFGTFLFLINNFAALLSKRITWRGIGYHLVSDTEVEIIRK